jgi:hypothetical protein
MALVVVLTAVFLSQETAAQTDPPADGNWIVDDVTVISDRAFRLNGNLTISSQGKLTLENVTMELNNTRPGRYHISVSSGGWLIVTDGDNDPITTGDASVIYSRNPNAGYGWFVSMDSVLRIQASTILHCQVLSIETNDAIISNATIRKGLYGIEVDGGILRMYDTTIGDCAYIGMAIGGATAILDGCTFINNSLEGIEAYQDSNLIIRNTTVSEAAVVGINVWDSTIEIEDCTIQDSFTAGVLTRRSTGYINRTSVTDCYETGISVMIDSNITVTDSTVYGINLTGIVYFRANGTIAGTHVSECGNQGIRVSTSGIQVFDSVIEESDQGIVITDSPLFIIDNCTVRRNSDTGIALSNNEDPLMAGWVMRSRIVKNEASGIYVAMNTTCILVDPHIRDNGLYGIYCRFGGTVEWEVRGNSTVINETLEFAGSIEVDDGGELTVINTTIEVNEDRSGQLGHISVNGGKMWISDHDPDVNGDHTEIYIDPSIPTGGAGFNITVYNGGNINATRSVFTAVRFDVTDGALSAIECDFDLSVQAVHGIGHTSLIELTGCTFSDGEQGVVTEDEARVNVSGCSFFRMEEGLNLSWTDGSSIKDSTMFSTEVGIRLWRAYGMTVDNCTFTFCGDVIVANLSDSVFINTSKVDRSISHGIRAWNTSFIVIDSVISQSGSGGVVIDGGSLQVWNSSFTNNDRYGIRANESILIMDATSVTGTDGDASAGPLPHAGLLPPRFHGVRPAIGGTVPGPGLQYADRT